MVWSVQSRDHRSVAMEPSASQVAENRPPSAEFVIAGLPASISESVAAVCRSRLLKAVSELARETDVAELALMVGTAAAIRKLISQSGSEKSEPSRSDGETPQRYSPCDPFYTFNQLVVPEQVRQELVAAIDVLRVESTVFDEWGLREIEPFPRTSLNFYGPPGTGKTLAAHALAHRMSRQILVVSYAEIESKYHGDGPKNVKALFSVAESEKAVLFIDEADSLLSKRLTNVTQGSEQAINSMRSQLLICLEQFSGSVIFSTNLVENYDKAFETRVRHIEFVLPDESCRAEIWRRHLVQRLPLAADVDVEVLAFQFDNVCGRDIKNAVIDAAVRVAIGGQAVVSQEALKEAINRIKHSRINQSVPLTEVEVDSTTNFLKRKLGKKYRGSKRQ